MNDNIIWLLLLFVFLIIVGLYISDYTPLELSNKQIIINENFSPSESNTTQQSEGASQLYNWGLPNDTQNNPPPNKCHNTCTNSCPSICPHKCPMPPPICHNQCNKSCPMPCDQKCEAPPSIPTCHNECKEPSCIESPKVNTNRICEYCDITLNKNIDKYVLKSSVPPCPDMSDYITKNMINSNVDLNNYILKSEIKPCDKIDISKYILKSEIPACPTCPICPECPICPVCPPFEESKCKKIYDYKITDHPDISNYVSKDTVNKYYTKNSNIIDSENINKYYKRNNNITDSENINNINSSTSSNSSSSSNSNSSNSGSSNSGLSNSNSSNSSSNNISNSEDNINNSNNISNIIKCEERPNINSHHMYNTNDNQGIQHNSNLIGYYAGDNLFAAV